MEEDFHDLVAAEMNAIIFEPQNLDKPWIEANPNLVNAFADASKVCAS